MLEEHFSCDDYDIQYNNYIDISMCKNTIVGEYIYYAKNVNQYENIEEVCCSMYNMDYEQALDFFREISEIEWTKHILDEMFFH